MPVRSLSSCVLKWPDARAVREALAAWAQREAPRHPGLVGLGYFGSYARGDWGVGSDLDLIAIAVGSSVPFERRASDWDLSELPVPADLVVYTLPEWKLLVDRRSRFAVTLLREACWLIEPPCAGTSDRAQHGLGR